MKETLKELIRKSRVYNFARIFCAGIGSILMLHRICPLEKKSKRKEIRGIEISPEFLEKIILFLKNQHYQFVSLDEAYEILIGKKKIERNFVAFTFDDGYIDSLTLAYPIFKKYSVPYTIFINTAFPDRKAMLWWYSLNELLDKNNVIEFALNGKEYTFTCSDTLTKDMIFSLIKNIITRLSKEDFCNSVSKIFESYGINPFQKTKELTLNWEQIQDISKDPLVTIGAHTINHFQLNELNESSAREEIAGSKRLLESKIGKPVEYFAYPFGTNQEVGNREFRLAKECGFKMAFTTRSGNISFKHRQYLESLPRIAVNGLSEDVQDLDMNLSGLISLFR
jgi:peptidoglycan/xylan/chitin deacetylase (PgdA/CDA1 family)